MYKKISHIKVQPPYHGTKYTFLDKVYIHVYDLDFIYINPFYLLTIPVPFHTISKSFYFFHNQIFSILRLIILYQTAVHILKTFSNTLTNKAQVIKRINCTYLSFYNYFTFNKDKRFHIIF